MTCILCLEYSDDDRVEIFSEKGTKLDACALIVKHFWLQPDDGSPLHREICLPCWDTLLKFHQFYLKVQNAHLHLTTKQALSDDLIVNPLKEEDDDKISEILISCTKLFEPEIKVEVKVADDLRCNEKDGQELLSVPAIVKSKRRRPRLKKITEKSDKDESDESEIPLAHLARLCAPKEETTGSADEFCRGSTPHPTTKAESESDSDKQFRVSHHCSLRKRKKHIRKSINTFAASEKLKERKLSAKYQLSKDYDDFLANNMKLTCCHCSSPMPNFLELKRHFRTEHQQRGYVLCCGKKFLKRGILVDHIHTHLDPNYFKCDKCNKIMADRRCLEVHMTVHETVKERKYQCEKCSKTFFRQTMLTRHMLIHVPKEECIFECPECSKSFASNYIMKQHLNNVHVNAYAKICDICGKSIRGRELFQRHQLEHAGVPMPTVQCQLCGTSLTNKYGLARHMKAMHLEENIKPQICTICAKVSPNVSAHQRHMNYVHDLKRNHQCPMCDKAFKRAQGLREHMTTHTGEVLYTCPHCPKTFNSNANMHSHRKKMHRREWEENRQKRLPTTEQSSL